jgi:ribonuclease HI
VDMGVRRVKVFGDSQLVMQQLKGKSQCLDETLNEYQEMCLEIISRLEEFSINYIPRSGNTKANNLA